MGCGPGWLWEQARADLPDDAVVTLTDLSSGMLREALTRVSPHFDELHGAAVDAGRLPFVDASFDVVLANHMLYHVPEPVRAVRELARVLRRSGTLVAATNGPAHLREVDEITTDVFGEPEQRKYSDRFGAAQRRRDARRTLRPGRVALVPRRSRLHGSGRRARGTCCRIHRGTVPTTRRAERLRAAIVARFGANGAMRITRESGAFVCRSA